MAVIEGRDLFVIHRASHGDVAALRGLTLTVGDAEMLAVLGPSGAGKSSLMTLCAGLRRPSSGTLTVAGVNVDSARRPEIQRLRRHHLGAITQHFHLSLPAELTATEIVSLPLRALGQWGAEERRRVDYLIERAGLKDRGDARPAELSGGEQQRVAICAALARRPKLVLADEPTGELDAENSRVVVELLRELTVEDGSACLVVTHDPAVADRADRVIHLRDGRVSAEGAESQMLVVDEQGWLRLPRGLRELRGVGSFVEAHATERGIELVPFGPGNDQEQAPPEEAIDAGPMPGRQVTQLPVEVMELSKAHRGQTVLSGLSHEFSPGTFHVVSGPSGSGKTTLLDLICALDLPDAGQILVGGAQAPTDDPEQLAAWRSANIGYLSQHATLTDTLSAVENVALGLSMRGWPLDEAQSEAELWLHWVGLGHAANRRSDRLSGGEQRRVALARAMAGQPPLLVVDEPTAHLDRGNGRRVLGLLKQAAHDHGVTVIASSHDADAFEAADALLTLDRAATR